MTDTRRQRLIEIRRMGIPIPPAVYTDLEQDTPSPNTRAWMWHAHVFARPTASTWNRAEDLERAQEAWDRSREHVDRQLEARAERDARLAAEREAEAAKSEAWRKQADDALVDQLRHAFMAANPSATAEDFQRNLPTLRDRHMQAETDRAQREARRRIGNLL